MSLDAAVLSNYLSSVNYRYVPIDTVIQDLKMGLSPFDLETKYRKTIIGKDRLINSGITVYNYLVSACEQGIVTFNDRERKWFLIR